MVSLVIGGIDVSKYLNESYKVSRSQSAKSGDSSFKNYDGEEVVFSTESTTRISAGLEDVPDGIAAAISDQTKEAVELSYTAPEMCEGKFLCTSCTATLDEHGYDGTPMSWYIDLEFQSLSEAKADGDGL